MSEISAVELCELDREEAARRIRLLTPGEQDRLWRAICAAHGSDAVWIYVVQAGSNGPVKIGRTGDVRRRLARLQHANGEELRLIGAWRAPPSMEKELHEDFADLRIRGEWFEPKHDLIAHARRLNIYEATG